MKRAIFLLPVLVLAGCANGGLGGLGGLFGGPGPAADTAPAAVPSGEVITEPVVGEAAAEDVAPAESSTRAAAVAAGNTATGDAVRGFTVASLGDATRHGLWIETPLVDRERTATVVAPDGTTVVVTASPSGGAQGSGSRLSLAAFQALGLSLASLPTVTVIAD